MRTIVILVANNGEGQNCSKPMVPRLTRARNKGVHLTETQQRCPENGTTTMGLSKLSLVV